LEIRLDDLRGLRCQGAPARLQFSDRYFRLLLIGYFEGLDAERAMAWRAADFVCAREFLGLVPSGQLTCQQQRRADRLLVNNTSILD
jgi:hypothetical protein